MQQASLFFLAVIVLLVIAYMVPPKKEGFRSFANYMLTPKNEGTPENCNSHQIEVNLPNQVSIAEAGVGNIEPAPPPANDLPQAPINARSQEAPNPYKDPTTEPAKYIRLLGVKEDLQAFFGQEAPALEAVADPALQIPLTRARADLSELIDVQSVIERNPGLPSRINNKQLNDIASNLRYLRSLNRDYVNSGVIHEGFVGSSTTATPAPVPSTTGATTAVPGSGVNPGDPNGPPATKEQLVNFLQRVQVEIGRLSASGTSDPIVKSRISTLQRMQQDVLDVIHMLEKKQITPDTVPIYASDIQKALPLLGKPTSPLPTILKKTNLPPAIANLFPGGMSPRDQNQMQQINGIFAGQMNKLFNNAKWNVGLNLSLGYDNRQAVKDLPEGNPISAQKQRANLNSPQILGRGVPGTSKTDDLRHNDTLQGCEQDPKANENAFTFSFGGPTKRTFDTGLPGVSDQEMALSEPTHLNWKQRVKEIVKQIKTRGLDPAVQGALPDNAEVSPDFSWRGHARMICHRVSASTDPGLAITVGCPPENWEGWRS